MALLALGAALFWGCGDFFGGLAAKRLAVLTVLLLSQAAGILGLLTWIVVGGHAFPGVVEVLPAIGAGFAGLVGLAALYRGLATGAMGIVAPISAAYPIVPLTIDLARGLSPSAIQWLGALFILAGVVVVSREPGSGRAPLAAGVGLAALAGLGFGFFVLGIHAASDNSAAWAVTVSRSTSVTIALVAALVLSAPLLPPRGLVPMVVAVGVFDTGANVLLALASTTGTAGIVAVLSALYPVATIVLARIVLGERLSVTRRAGGGVAIAGAALVAAG